MKTILSRLEGFDHVIWDWNGTLLDDAELAVRVKNQVLEECGLPTLTLERYREIFEFPVQNYYARLGFDFTTHPFEKVADRFIQLYGEAARHARLFAGAEELLAAVRARVRQQSILSAASQWHLDEITRHLGVHARFDRVYGIDNHYADSKLGRGRELLEASGIPAARTILIGDTNHDAEVAHELGVASLLIADGHQSYARLSAGHANTLESRFS
jgi:phosphoglycolate phosphatase